MDGIIPSEVLAATVSAAAFALALYFPAAYFRRKEEKDRWSTAQPGLDAMQYTCISVVVSFGAGLLGGQRFWNDVKINIEYPNAKPVDLNQ